MIQVLSSSRKQYFQSWFPNLDNFWLRCNSCARVAYKRRIKWQSCDWCDETSESISRSERIKATSRWWCNSLRRRKKKRRSAVCANRYVHSNGTGTRNWSSNWPLGKSSGRIAKIAQCVPGNWEVKKDERIANLARGLKRVVFIILISVVARAVPRRRETRQTWWYNIIKFTLPDEQSES